MPEENNGIVGQEISPRSAIPGVDYCDFSYIYNNKDPMNEEFWNFDCTNFTSHCLIAGGAQMNYPNKPKKDLKIESTGWFFDNINQRSSSWSSVNAFYNFVTTNTGKGVKATSAEYSSSGLISSSRILEQCDIGDIIQIDYKGEGKYDHNTVVTNACRVNGKYYPAVCGRSGSRYFELQRDEYYATKNVCVISCKAAIGANAKFRVLRLTSLV